MPSHFERVQRKSTNKVGIIAHDGRLAYGALRGCHRILFESNRGLC
jgi:hypothetical protein